MFSEAYTTCVLYSFFSRVILLCAYTTYSIWVIVLCTYTVFWIESFCFPYNQLILVNFLEKLEAFVKETEFAFESHIEWGYHYYLFAKFLPSPFSRWREKELKTFLEGARWEKGGQFLERVRAFRDRNYKFYYTSLIWLNIYV